MPIEYRSFRNADPPRLVQLWHNCELGRGAALGFPCEAMDLYVFAEPYFEARGLIVACSGSEIVGCVHAGFGANADESALSREVGVVCAVMVRPDFRKQGIGRELMARAEAYLRAAGAQQIQAGEADRLNPFYLGLYGGSESVGFLESDPNAAAFFQRIGYVPAERRLLFRRDLTQKQEGFDPRLVAIRRRLQLGIMNRPSNPTWWWMTRQGRLDSLYFVLATQTGVPPVASVTGWGMDMHSLSWRERTIGFVGLHVAEQERRKGYGKALLLDAMRRLREELFTHVEAAALETNKPAVGLLQSTGFQQVDVGVVYRPGT